MNKAFDFFLWENYPSINTPLNEQNLNKVSRALDEIDNRVIVHDMTKFNTVDAQGLIKSIEFNHANGVFTITYVNGATSTIDTILEKIAVNFDFDETTQQLVITLDDGTEKRVDLSAFITPLEFIDSGTIDFQILENGKVAAIVKEGSIEEKHLRPNYLAEIKVESAKAAASAAAAAQSEAKAAASETAAKKSEDAAQESKMEAASSASSAGNSASTATEKAEAAAASAESSAGSAETATEKSAAAAQSETSAATSAATATQKASAAAISATTAGNKAEEASGHADLSRSYAVGTGGEIRENDDTDCAEYYYEQVKRISQSFSGVVPMGTTNFEGLSNPENQIPGYMFNISDSFVSDDRFADGGGIFYGAGSNVVYTADGTWDVLAASMVSGVKGAAETEYRQGFVNLNPKDIGAMPINKVMHGIDLDDLMAAGFYEVIGDPENPLSHAPEDHKTGNFYVLVLNRGTSYIKQISWSVRKDRRIFIRGRNAAVWDEEWAEIDPDITPEKIGAVPRYTVKIVPNSLGWYRVCKIKMLSACSFILNVVREWDNRNSEGFSISVNAVMKTSTLGADIYNVSFSQINSVWASQLIDKVRIVCDNQNKGYSYIDLHYNYSNENDFYVRLDNLSIVANESSYDVEVKSFGKDFEVVDQTIHEYEIIRRGSVSDYAIKAIKDVDGKDIPETYCKRILKSYTDGKDMDEYREEGWWYIGASTMATEGLHHPLPSVGGEFNVKVTPNRTGASEPWGVLQKYYAHTGTQTQPVRVFYRHFFIDTGWSDWSEKISVNDVSNPNLLINPDFRINQRGKKDYTGGNIYTVDRWKTNSAPGNLVTVNDKYITISTTSDGYYKEIIQIIENYEELKGKYVTLSAKVRTQGNNFRFAIYDNIYSHDIAPSDDWTIQFCTFKVPEDAKKFVVGLNLKPGFVESMDVAWVKLEVGLVFTPFISPDPSKELQKCYRYYYNGDYRGDAYYIVNTDIASGFCKINFYFPAMMRVSPTTKVFSRPQNGEPVEGIVTNLITGLAYDNLKVHVNRCTKGGVDFLAITTGYWPESLFGGLYFTADAEIY